jgi:hypothetical protein
VIGMNIKKRIGIVLTTLLVITTLVACGTTDTKTIEPKKVVNGSKGDAPAGIVSGQLTPLLEKVISEGKITYIFKIKNDQEQNDVLHYSSSQQYDYKLTEGNGNVVYTYSMDKIFAQATTEQTLKPGEMVQFTIDLSEDLPKVKAGTYQIEVWSTATDRADLKAISVFNWDGEEESVEEDPILPGDTVTYVGLMDNNSIEVINADGENEHYRLAENVKATFETLESNTKITIYYIITSDGQKMIEEVITE